MPYRRLPNTDKARCKALMMAQTKGEIHDMFDLAFSQKLLFEIQGFMPRYEREINSYQQGLQRQVSSNRGYQEKLKKARLYVSHFMQAVNMAVMRGELKESDQVFLGMEEGAKSVPVMATEASLVEWGQRVIEGDTQRISNGGTPIYLPSMANVKVHFERFYDSYKSQKFLQSNTNRLQDAVCALREEADDLILRIWNEVEENFIMVMDQEERLDLCREYGVIYYYRKGEKVEP